MLKFDEALSTYGFRTYTFSGKNFLESKSVLYYLDDVDPELYDSLKSKIMENYEDRKDIEFRINSFNQKKTMGIWIIMNFNEKDHFSKLTEDFQKEFEQKYEELKKEILNERI
jgi:hypothetical protein